VSLKVMAWNIAEGKQLERVADEIRAAAPDIVLLNEILQRRWFFQTDQPAWLSEHTGLPHYAVGETVMMGLAGWKAVAVLSRFEVQRPIIHRVISGSRETTYAMLDVDCRVGNIPVRLFALRFDAHNLDDNIAGHKQLVGIVRGIDPSAAVIVGGDFNTPVTSAHMVQFRTDSGLADTLLERPDPNACENADNPRIDYIFYRGPYVVTRAQLGCPWAASGQTEASDHGWVFAEFADRPVPSLQHFREPVTADPSPLPVGAPVRVTVRALDAVSASSVPGAQVHVVNYDSQGREVAMVVAANSPFMITFRIQRVLNHQRRPPVWEEGEYPSAVVKAVDYADAVVHFDWSS
jgi:endonuclease/exonuclease/phosphatase family metal-dependent hydrolase